MSLFENEQYRWRETYFVLFDVRNRPSLAATRAALEALGGRYEVTDMRTDDDGQFESLTLISPSDFSAMDISYVSGEEVTDQLDELTREIRDGVLTREEQEKIDQLPLCDARFDIYHFEQVIREAVGDDEAAEFLDPGALLMVLEGLTELCGGVGIDPQSGTVM